MSSELLRAALSDRYRLERELGQGGMATVYLAHDLKHDRDVAIKVLHDDLGAALGAERFLTEIRTTARLQHPHILPLLDSGEAAGLLYYVMPLVTGETLRDRLTREQQLPVDDAVLIARGVADALGYAHELGVIHRDIKPENILLQGGHALVADFGIALAVQTAGGQRMTQTGLSLGTPAYMSPEQAMGERTIDARSDLYALGAVAYEMLVGEPPFTGPSVQAIVARLVTEEPRAIAVQRKAVPEAVEEAVLRALEKLPADRFGSAAEFIAALTADGGTTTRRTRAHAAAPATSRASRFAPWLVAGAGLAIAAWAFLRPGPSPGPAVYDVGLPDSARMNLVGSVSRIGPYGALVRNLSIDRNGEFVVYAATRGDSTSLWYRSLRTAEVRELLGTEGATGPRVSPNGAEVGYFAGDRMMAAPVAGGEPRLLMMATSGTMVDWTEANQFITVDNDGYRFNRFDPATGGTQSMTIARCTFGVWVPESAELLCSFNGTAQAIDPDAQSVVTIRIADADGTAGAPASGSAFRTIEGRYLLWLATDGNLVGATYDVATHLAGPPIRLLDGIRREALGEGQFDISETGTLVYAPGLDATIGRLVRFRPGEGIEALPIDPADYQRYDLSRDGRWLAVVTPGTEGAELRIHDLRTGQRSTWLRAEGIRHAMWNPGGDRLLASIQHDTTWALLRGVPGSGEPADTLATWGPGQGSFDPVGFPFDSVAIGLDWTSGVMVRFDPRDDRSTFDTVLTGARFPSVSPSGRLVTYQTVDESRIVVTTFPEVGRRWQVATLGVEPIWLSDTELLYRFGAIWYMVRVDPATGEPQGAATQWGRDPRFSDTSGWSNRPDHAGGVIYVESPEQADPGYLRVIPNWVDQMKQAVDGANR
ncbi:MAG: protein kinase [Gemmatimonadales bacterium]